MITFFKIFKFFFSDFFFDNFEFENENKILIFTLIFIAFSIFIYKFIFNEFIFFSFISKF